MKKKTALAFLFGSMALFIAGCSDDPGAPDKEPIPDPPQYGMPPGNNDSDMDDGSYWPKWKNPCPGPACDPPRKGHPEWVVDPPPDRGQGGEDEAGDPPHRGQPSGRRPPVT